MKNKINKDEEGGVKLKANQNKSTLSVFEMNNISTLQTSKKKEEEEEKEEDLYNL